MKPNCYKCVYRGNVPGSAHSCCNHPAFSDVTGDPFLQMVGIFAGVGRVPPIQAKTADCKVVGNPHGIKNGWFNHPFNFDPVWLESCTGYKAKEGDNDRGRDNF